MRQGWGRGDVGMIPMYDNTGGSSWKRGVILDGQNNRLWEESRMEQLPVNLWEGVILVVCMNRNGSTITCVQSMASTMGRR